ncbi:cytochrome c [bacterium]|jgi:mono/diheme cytochrome c family protein|nr:cytochrome c [bacterium]
MKSIKCIFCILFLVSVVFQQGCRGWRTEKNPFHLNPNMDWQSKFNTQKFTEEIPHGTVAWGRGAVYSENKSRPEMLGEGPVYTGQRENGDFLESIPLNVDLKMLERGQERYAIYCAVCHDRTGAGNGMVVQRGFVKPPNLSDERIREFEDGRLFSVITDGIRTMPAYSKQIDAEDRWAIVAYVRALQTMNNASINDVPENLKYLLK